METYIITITIIIIVIVIIIQQVEETIKISIAGLNCYINTSEETFICASRQITKQNSSILDPLEVKKEERRKRHENWTNKRMHGQFKRQTEPLTDSRQWLWLKDGSLKKTTEGLIIAAQDQSLRTNAVKAKIDKSQTDSKCRLCKETDETVTHIVSGCKTLAQKDYKRRHDEV